MSAAMALTLFGVLSMVLVFVDVMNTYASQGIGFGFSSNRPVIQKTGLALRIERSFRNQVEACAYILPILAAAAMFAPATPGVETAALLVILGRVGFVVMYYTGLPFARVPFFVLANVSALYLAYVVLTNLPA